jgi:hypothetical protein
MSLTNISLQHLTHASLTYTSSPNDTFLVLVTNLKGRQHWSGLSGGGAGVRCRSQPKALEPTTDIALHVL